MTTDKRDEPVSKRSWRLWTQWTLATSVGYRLTLLLGSFVTPLTVLSLLPLILACLGTATLCQWVILRLWGMRFNALYWTLLSLLAFLGAFAAAATVGAICTLLLLTGSRGGNYLPYGVTMLISRAADALVVVCWLSGWCGLAAAQWRMLGKYLASYARRRTWIAYYFVAGMVVAIAGFLVAEGRAKRLEGTTGAVYLTDITPLLLLSAGLIAGALIGAITGTVFIRTLSGVDGVRGVHIEP